MFCSVTSGVGFRLNQSWGNEGKKKMGDGKGFRMI